METANRVVVKTTGNIFEIDSHIVKHAVDMNSNGRASSKVAWAKKAGKLGIRIGMSVAIVFPAKAWISKHKIALLTTKQSQTVGSMGICLKAALERDLEERMGNVEGRKKSLPVQQ